MTNVNLYEFVSISSSFSFDLAGATLFLTPFMRTSSYYIFQGVPEAVFDTEENEDRVYNLHFNYPFFYKFVIIINSFFFYIFFFLKKKKFTFVLFILICTPSLYVSMLTSGNWSSLSSTRSGRMFCCACSGKRAICGISSLFLLFPFHFCLFKFLHTRCIVGDLTFPFQVVLLAPFLMVSFTTNGPLDSTF